jgi:hypothetical protein
MELAAKRLLFISCLMDAVEHDKQKATVRRQPK